MFDLPLQLRRRGAAFHIVWHYAYHPKEIFKYVTKDDIRNFDIKAFCGSFKEALPSAARAEHELNQKFSMHLTGYLLLGLVRVFDFHADILVANAERAVERTSFPSQTPSIEEIADRLIQDTHGEFPEGDEHSLARQQPEMDNDFDFGAEQVAPQEEIEEARGERQPRRRAANRKRNRQDSDDDDEDYGRRKPRRKPTRKAAVSNVADRDEITIRDEGPFMGNLEQDLLADDLEAQPLNEQELAAQAEGVPFQLNNDTLVVVTGFPGAQNNDTNQPAAIHSALDSFEPARDNDFDHQDFDVPVREGSPSRLISHMTLTSPGRQKDATVNLPIFRARTPQDGVHIVHSRSATPALQDAFYRAITPAPLPEVDNDFDFAVDHLALHDESERPRVMDGLDIQQYHIRSRSNSPSRLISIHIINTPAKEVPSDLNIVPPTSRTGSPFRDGFRIVHSRSVTPAPQGFHQAMSRSVTPANRLEGDNDFDYAAEPNTTRDLSRRLRVKPPKRAAREPAIVLDNAIFRGRDEAYLNKNLRETKYQKILEHLANAKDTYKKCFGDDLNFEVNAELREFLEDHMENEHARRRKTGDTEVSGRRPHSHLTDTLQSDQRTPLANLTSRRGTPIHQEPLQAFDQPPSRAVTPVRHHEMDNDFDYAAEPPPRFASRTPAASVYGDIQYVEPVPLPPVAQPYLTPPRALPLEFMNSTAQSPIKELACKYKHDELYLVILQRCFNERKVVFEFAEFASNWPKPYIAKQFHNLMLLIEQHKLLGRTENGVFHSFLILPTEEFKTTMARILCKP